MTSPLQQRRACQNVNTDTAGMPFKYVLSEKRAQSSSVYAGSAGSQGLFNCVYSKQRAKNQNRKSSFWGDVVDPAEIYQQC